MSVSWYYCQTLTNLPYSMIYNLDNPFRNVSHTKMSLTLNEPIYNVLCSNLHMASNTCTSSLPNMEGFVSKITNSLPKVMMNQRITLLGSHNFRCMDVLCGRQWILDAILVGYYCLFTYFIFMQILAQILLYLILGWALIQVRKFGELEHMVILIPMRIMSPNMHLS